MRYHLAPVRMAFFNKPTKKNVGEDVEKRKPLCTIGGNTDWCSHCGNQYKVPPQIKNGSALWPNDSTSGNLSKETQNTNLNEHKHTCVHCSFIYSHQDMESAQMSINRWVDKIDVVHLHNVILFNYKKRRKSYILWQHGWTWRVVCEVK